MCIFLTLANALEQTKYITMSLNLNLQANNHEQSRLNNIIQGSGRFFALILIPLCTPYLAT